MKRKTRKGITLIEVLISISIMGILLTSIASFIGVNENIKKRNESLSEVEIQGWEVMHFILESIQNSQSVSSPLSGETTDSLTLLVDESSKNPTLFTANEEVLFLQEGTLNQIPLTDSHINIKNLSFSNAGASTTKGSIKIQFDMHYSGTNSDTDYNKTFYGTATLR